MIGRLLCWTGSHRWSCGNSLSCRGGSDHFCLRCNHGLPEWTAARIREASQS